MKVYTDKTQESETVFEGEYKDFVEKYGFETLSCLQTIFVKPEFTYLGDGWFKVTIDEYLRDCDRLFGELVGYLYNEKYEDV